MASFWEFDRSEGSFDDMAAVEIVADSTLPAGFSAKRLEQATYVVFRITLNGGPLHPQIKTAMAKIWGDLVPASGLKIADGPDFERYDGVFAPTRPGAVIDFMCRSRSDAA